MQEWTIEELKTYIGGMTSDLRGDWSENYTGRISDVIQAYESLIGKFQDFCDELGSYMEDLKVAEGEYNEPYDGRVFRNCCSLYGYTSDEGFTERVLAQLKLDCNNPECI